MFLRACKEASWFAQSGDDIVLGVTVVTFGRMILDILFRLLPGKLRKLYYPVPLSSYLEVRVCGEEYFCIVCC